MGERESTDIVIIDNRDVVFLEVVGTFVPLDTIASLDKSRVDDLFRKFVSKKARELHDRIEDYRAGLWSPGIAASDAHRIFPVIIVPAHFPRSLYVQQRIDDLIQRNGWLQSTEGLEIIDTALLEGLDEHFRAGLSLPDLITESLSTLYGVWKAWNYLMLWSPQMQLRIDVGKQRRLDSWIRRIKSVVEGWFCRVAGRPRTHRRANPPIAVNWPEPQRHVGFTLRRGAGPCRGPTLFH
ncbi:MAG: hypothetical protein QOJ39_684 [Candidatus Eremiobacteraeota bacterium]|jgi:hypothetical protein|nr:hypothetical protein [Candidatus Eremiobacteraeota bacterium]